MNPSPLFEPNLLRSFWSGESVWLVLPTARMVHTDPLIHITEAEAELADRHDEAGRLSSEGRMS